MALLINHGAALAVCKINRSSDEKKNLTLVSHSHHKAIITKLTTMTKEEKPGKIRQKTQQDSSLLVRLIIAAIFLASYMFVIQWVTGESLGEMLLRPGRTALVLFPWVIIVIFFSVSFGSEKKNNQKKSKKL